MRRSALLIAVLLALLMISSCTTALKEERVPDSAWEVDSFLYQLQRANAERIGKTAFDLVIATTGVAGSSTEVVPALKNSPGGPKTVLAYLSIGQAEDYRFYWDPSWNETPPSWLDSPDEDWRGDYWVEYWDDDWQEVIFGTEDSYLDFIMDLGFDGIYLDRVDAYQYFEERDGRDTAAAEMVEFITRMTEYARNRRPGFGVFPQNAEELGVQFPEYLELMTGIGVEDLYYGDHEPTPANWTAEREEDLLRWVEAGKLVLTTDYTARPEQVSDAYRRSLGNGFVPYVTDRSLGRIVINDGFEPEKSPEEYVFDDE